MCALPSFHHASNVIISCCGLMTDKSRSNRSLVKCKGDKQKDLPVSWELYCSVQKHDKLMDCVGIFFIVV